MTREDLLTSLYKYANKPYIFGQAGPLYYDCSGLVYNILCVDLKIGPYQRLTAQGYYDYFKANGTTVLPGSSNLGDLCFFGIKDKIHHVGLCLNKTLMFEAAHGDRSCINEVMSKSKGAKVEVNPIGRLSDLYEILRPNALELT